MPGHLFDTVHDALIADEAVITPVLDANPAAAAAMVARLEDAIARGLWTPRRNAVHGELAGVRAAAAKSSGARMTASAPELVVSQVRGWCPGALRPMQSGDGLIVRLRPRGHLTPAQLLAIAALAERHGNGLIDLTRRANIQMRGVEGESLPALWAALAELDLLDAGAEAEAVRNVLSSPLAGIDKSELLDPRPLVASLESALAHRSELWALPAKFCFVVDGGGALSLDEERADIRLLAVQRRQRRQPCCRPRWSRWR